jgi:hypothetical protein
MNAIEVQRCYDADFIDDVMNFLLPEISTDQTPATVSSGSVMDNPDFIFLSVGDREGFVMLVRDEVHAAFMPSLRGRRAIQAGKAVLSWIWDNTSLPTLKAYVYSHRPDVRFFARIMGFHPTTVENDGSTVNGISVLKTNFLLPRPCLPQ